MDKPKQQTIVVGPLAAFVPMKMLGTNGGGFYGMNSAHPFENPDAGTQSSSPRSCDDAVSDGAGPDVRADAQAPRHAVVIFSVMLMLLVGHGALDDLL